MSRGGSASLPLFLLAASIFAACSRKPTEPVAKDTLLPSAITDLAVLRTSDSSITLTWTAPGDDNGKRRVSAYEVRSARDPLVVYYWYNATPIETVTAPHDPGLPETLDVKGLITGRMYNFGVKSVDAAGNHSPVSNIVQSDPRDRTPPDAVQDLRATPKSAGTVLLSWTASGDDGRLGAAARYDVRYGRYTVSAGTWPGLTRIAVTAAPNAAGSPESLLVDNLSSSAPYDFALKAIDDAGNISAISNVARASTEPDLVPPGTVTDLRVTSTTAHSAALEWTAPGDDGGTGTVTSYEIRWASFSIEDQTWAMATKTQASISPKLAGQTQRVIVYYLQPSTRYFFALQTRDEGGNLSQVSNSPQAQTGSDAGGQWRVSLDGSGDFTSIQAAIDSAAAGDLILVAPGRYEECLNFGDKDVVLRSEKGADVTTLADCGAGRALVYFGPGTTRNTMLEGFTITGVEGRDRDTNVIRVDMGSPTIINNIIRDNGATAMVILGGNSVIRGNRFIDNEVGFRMDGGGIVLAAKWDTEPLPWGEPIVEENIFDSNKATGGGGAMMIGLTSARVVNNVFRNNSSGYDGGAIFILPECDRVLIEGNHFLGNVAGDHGGAIAAWEYQNYNAVSWVEIRGNLFEGNEAKGFAYYAHGFDNGVGGAIHLSGLHGMIIENTIVKNRGYPPCGGSGITFYIDARYMPNPVGPWIVERNIIAFNLDGGITCRMGAEDYAKNNLLFQNVHDFGCGSGLCDSSVVRDNWVGDPMFCDPAAGDWRVDENSPAITSPVGPLGAFPIPGCGRPETARRMHGYKQ